MMPEDSYLLTITALNMLIISIHRITSSGDMLVLDSEYKNITNIINNFINPDPELISLCQDILNLIDNGRRRHEIRQDIANMNSKKETRNSWQIIWQMGKKLCNNAIKSVSIDHLKWGEQFIVSSASDYITKREEAQKLAQNNDDTLRRLKQEELDEYSKLRNKLMETSWRLLQRSGLRDSYRITRDCLSSFTDALSIANPLDRQLLLGQLEPELSEYAPYWFYRLEALMEIKEYVKAEEYFKKFIDTWKHVLGRDPYMAEAMKYRIEILMCNGVNFGNVEEILCCLSKMIEHTRLKDWENHFFAGTIYFSLGRRDEATRHMRISYIFSSENEEILELLKSMETGEIPPRIEPLSDEDFVNLCEAGDARNVEEALMLGANPNAKKESRTALICAIRGAKISTKIVELLLKYGAYVNAMDEDGRTALMIAVVDVHYGKEQVVKLLLKYGADVNASDENGRTVLMIAVADYCTDEVVELLLNYKSDVNASDNAGITALMIAAHRGKTEVVRLFLCKGADINAKDNDGSTVLMWAGNVAVAKLLLNNEADVNARDNNGMTALMHADDELVAELILNYRADVDAKNKSGMTALMIAANHGKEQVVKLLLKYGADVNIRDENGMTALMWAGNVAVAELLLDSKAKVNVKDKNGMTALMHAADDVLIADLLLNSGANINAKDKNGMTALMLAVKENYPDFEWLLRDHGAK